MEPLLDDAALLGSSAPPQYHHPVNHVYMRVGVSSASRARPDPSESQLGCYGRAPGHDVPLDRHHRERRECCRLHVLRGSGLRWEACSCSLLSVPSSEHLRPSCRHTGLDLNQCTPFISLLNGGRNDETYKHSRIARMRCNAPSMHPPLTSNFSLIGDKADTDLAVDHGPCSKLSMH